MIKNILISNKLLIIDVYQPTSQNELINLNFLNVFTDENVDSYYLKKNTFNIKNFWLIQFMVNLNYKDENIFYIFLRGLQKHGKYFFTLKKFKKSILYLKRHTKFKFKLLLKNKNNIYFYNKNLSLDKKLSLYIVNLNIIATKYYKLTTKRKWTKIKSKFSSKLLQGVKSINEFSLWYRRSESLQFGRFLELRWSHLFMLSLISKRNFWECFVKKVGKGIKQKQRLIIKKKKKKTSLIQTLKLKFFRLKKYVVKRLTKLLQRQWRFPNFRKKSFYKTLSFLQKIKPSKENMGSVLIGSLLFRLNFYLGFSVKVSEFYKATVRKILRERQRDKNRTKFQRLQKQRLKRRRRIKKINNVKRMLFKRWQKRRFITPLSFYLQKKLRYKKIKNLLTLRS